MSRSVLSRAAWGLDSGSESSGSWRRFAICAQQPELWEEGGGNNAKAVHMCVRHCPVLEPCRADAEEHRPQSGVQGGIVWRLSRNRYKGDHAVQPKPIKHARFCDNWEGAL